MSPHGCHIGNRGGIFTLKYSDIATKGGWNAFRATDSRTKNVDSPFKGVELSFTVAKRKGEGFASPRGSFGCKHPDQGICIKQRRGNAYLHFCVFSLTGNQILIFDVVNTLRQDTPHR